MQGHIHKRVHTCKNGRLTTRWYVVVDVGRSANGRRRQKWHGGFRTRREAEIVRARLVSELHAGTYVMPDRLTLSQWVSGVWLPLTAARVKPTTLHSYRRNLELHVLPELGARPLQFISPPMLDTLYARLIAVGSGRGPLSRKTVRYVHSIVRSALEHALDAGLLARNVADRARPPRSPHPAHAARAWGVAELARFLESVRGTRLDAVWRLAAMSGLRRGELLALRWADLDMPAARLSVHRASVTVGYRVLESTPKGGDGRVIDLDAETIAGLREHRERQDAERREWGRDYEEGELIVAWENGSPIHPHSFTGQFRRLVRDAGLRPIRLHDIRHTHATLALMAGAPVKVVSERLGHRSPAFTLRQYAHVIPGMQADAAAAMAELVAREQARPVSARPCHLVPDGW